MLCTFLHRHSLMMVRVKFFILRMQLYYIKFIKNLFEHIQRQLSPFLNFFQCRLVRGCIQTHFQAISYR